MQMANTSNWGPPPNSNLLDILLEESAEVQTGGQKVELHTILYIPFILFVFCGPFLFILVLCYIQRRNRKLQRRDIEKLQNRRLSTQSDIYVGVQFAGSLPSSAGCLRASPLAKVNSIVVAGGASRYAGGTRRCQEQEL